MAAKKTPVFDHSLCVSCSICAQICPVSCIVLSEYAGKGDKNLYPAVSGDCLGCGTCQRSCPMDAISMKESL